MKKIILSTLATLAFSISAVAEPLSPPEEYLAENKSFFQSTSFDGFIYIHVSGK